MTGSATSRVTCSTKAASPPQPSRSHGSGEYAPIPPVFGPSSPSCRRLKSCAGLSARTVSPSLRKKSDTSGPDRNSSTSTPPVPRYSAAWARAASRSSVTMTPLPAARPSAFTTCGAPNSSSAAATSSRVAAWVARPVGTPAACMMRLANAFDPSSCAAALPGPNVGMPRSRSASATPATRGASGPITTSPIDSVCAKEATATGSFASSVTTVTSRAMPAFPGAAKMSCASPSLRSDVMIACSRAPEPRTRIRTRSAYRSA